MRHLPRKDFVSVHIVGHVAVDVCVLLELSVMTFSQCLVFNFGSGAVATVMRPSILASACCCNVFVAKVKTASQTVIQSSSSTVADRNGPTQHRDSSLYRTNTHDKCPGSTVQAVVPGPKV